MTYRFARGAWIACFCAGPIFVAMLAFAAAAENPALPVIVPAGWSEILAGSLLGAIPVIVIGALLASAPVLLGGALLARVGTANVGVRHPACWAILGGAIPGTAITALDMGDVQQFNVALIATGTICALLVRYGTRWPGDSA